MKTLRLPLIRFSLASWALLAPCVESDGGSPQTSPKDEILPLPPPLGEGAISVEEALARRRSQRAFKPGPLTSVELGQLLFAAQGMTDPGTGRRAAPSAGATYPLETYVVTGDGLFRYLVRGHALQCLRKGDHRAQLAAAALDQECLRDAAAVVVFTAVPERTTRRYGERGIRYIHMEVGHAAENLHLQAVALGLGSVPVGAFDDEEVAAVLGIAAPAVPLYLVAVGRI